MYKFSLAPSDSLAPGFEDKLALCDKTGCAYVEISDIDPQELSQQYTVVVNGTLTVKYSPLNYLANMDRKGDSTLQTLVRALYAYHLAAQNYLK